MKVGGIWYDGGVKRFIKKLISKQRLVYLGGSFLIGAELGARNVGDLLNPYFFGGFLGFLILGMVKWPRDFKIFKKHYFDLTAYFLFVLPGLLGYYLMSQRLPDWASVVAGLAWAAGSYLFLRIPLIEKDKDERLKTTAVLLGEKNSLLLASLLYLLCANLVMMNDYLGGENVFVLVYPILPILVYYHRLSLGKAMQAFYYINPILGFLFFLVALPI